MAISVPRYLLFLLILSLVACDRSFRPTIKTGFEGQPLPAFQILLPDSSTILNTADLPKEGPVVLVYFGPNCPYSQAEMANILKDISNLKSVQFCFFTNWPFRQMRGFFDYYKLGQFSNIVVGQDFKNYFSVHFNPVGVPFTMIYDKDRRLNQAFVGTMPGKQIRDVSISN